MSSTMSYESNNSHPKVPHVQNGNNNHFFPKSYLIFHSLNSIDVRLDENRKILEEICNILVSQIFKVNST